MATYKVEVTRTLVLRKVLYVKAPDEGLAESRALLSMEEMCDDSMDIISSSEDATATRALNPEEEAGCEVMPTPTQNH